MRILVSLLSRVVSRGIRRVSFEGLERVEVQDGTRGVGVELLVDNLLVVVVPHLSVKLTVFKVEGGGDAAVGNRGEGRSRSNKGGEKGELHLWEKNRKRRWGCQGEKKEEYEDDRMSQISLVADNMGIQQPKSEESGSLEEWMSCILVP